MEDFTRDDDENIATYQSYSSEDLFYTVEALHTVKAEEVDKDLLGRLDTTISLIREILIQRKALH